MPITIRRLAAGLLVLAAGPAAAADPVFPAAPLAEAWKMLPRKTPDLPAWARALAPALPRGTTKLIELDDLHRTASPLGPALRAKLRYAVADANDSPYGKEYADADLAKSGDRPEFLDDLLAPDKLPADERLAVAFARKMSTAAYQVTDAEVAELVKHYGYRGVVGIIHTVAYANFQDRLLLGLGTEVEPGGPLPPTGLTFELPKLAKRPPAKKAGQAEPKADAPPAGKADKFDWNDGAPDLAARLEAQKARAPRIPPVEARMLAGLPESARAEASKIVWSNLSMGYQPRLTAAWFTSMSAAYEDAQFDRGVSNTVFWIVTRSNQCFY